MGVVPSSSETVELIFPVMIAGVASNKLTVRRPKVRDRIAHELHSKQNSDESPHQNECVYLANLCDIDPSAFQEMDYADFLAVQKKVADMQLFTAAKK